MDVHPMPRSFVRLFEVHHNDVEVGRETAVALGERCSPGREVLSAHPVEMLCDHQYWIWAVELAGPDHRVDYLPGLSGPHLPFIAKNPDPPARPNEHGRLVILSRPSEK